MIQVLLPDSDKKAKNTKSLHQMGDYLVKTVFICFICWKTAKGVRDISSPLLHETTNEIFGTNKHLGKFLIASFVKYVSFVD